MYNLSCVKNRPKDVEYSGNFQKHCPKNYSQLGANLPNLANLLLSHSVSPPMYVCIYVCINVSVCMYQCINMYVTVYVYIKIRIEVMKNKKTEEKKFVANPA
jgi:hypothetical protein